MLGLANLNKVSTYIYKYQCINIKATLGILDVSDISNAGVEIVTSRFSKPVAEVEILAKIRGAALEWTKYKGRWAVNLF